MKIQQNKEVSISMHYFSQACGLHIEILEEHHVNKALAYTSAVAAGNHKMKICNACQWHVSKNHTSRVSLNKFQFSIRFNASTAFLLWFSSDSSLSIDCNSFLKSFILSSSSEIIITNIKKQRNGKTTYRVAYWHENGAHKVPSQSASLDFLPWQCLNAKSSYMSISARRISIDWWSCCNI